MKPETVEFTIAGDKIAEFRRGSAMIEAKRQIARQSAGKWRTRSEHEPEPLAAACLACAEKFAELEAALDLLLGVFILTGAGSDEFRQAAEKANRIWPAISDALLDAYNVR
jgi:hypothetical protein